MSDRSYATKVLTIMMTDIVGSTALWRARGGPNPDDIFGSQAEIVQDKVMAFGGRVHKSLGDGFLISFPSADAAVSAAVAIQRTWHDYNTANPDRAVEIRIGIHLGQVAESDGDLLGQAVHVAARVMAEAVGGQILTYRRGAQARRTACGLVLSQLGVVLAARVSRALAAVRGVVEGQPRRAPAALLCPRSRRWWSGTPSGPPCVRLVDAALVGRGKLAMIAGEPGVGKSRLVAEIGNEARRAGCGCLPGIAWR